MDVHYSDRLRPRLHDPDATVREHAVRTLVHIGAWGGQDAMAASLMSACCDPDPAVQRAAVDALVAALEGDQATAARAVMKRVYEQGAEGLHLPPLLRMMLEE
jgi:HEAT repeat protein